MKKQPTNVIASNAWQSYIMELILKRLLQSYFLRNDVLKKSLLLFILFFSISSFSQEENIKWRTIPSLTDWAKEVNSSPDSIYNAKNIKVLLDVKKDSLLIEKLSHPIDTTKGKIALVFHKNITVDGLRFDNIFGTSEGKIIKNLHFKGWLRISNYSSKPISGFFLKNIIFDDRFSIQGTDNFSYFNFYSCEFKSWVGFFDFSKSSVFSFNNVKIKEHIQLTRCLGKPFVLINNSDFNKISFPKERISEIEIRNSTIHKMAISDAVIESKFHLINNDIQLINLAGAQLPENNTYIPFSQISSKLFVQPRSINRPNALEYTVSDSMDFGLKEDYDLLISSYKTLLSSYQNRGDQDSYNNSYVEMKDVETRRLEYLYTTTPTFKGFFTWKINQFLKVFSAYGTEPARSIIFSLYVILLFALIYLFFPNTWDTHGKKRIMDRYSFFFKYMNKKAGIHEVYLEDKKDDILEFDDFKTIVEKQGKTVPKFFTATALPLYKWAVSGTKFSASILRRFDIMKGTWNEVPKKKRIWKSILLIGAFLIAICYDIIIKMLNALMLSINTFTTLGFGEIPIKGLPRYLAIIQGFIGWFMLTIFSVSLISQLLN